MRQECERERKHERYSQRSARGDKIEAVRLSRSIALLLVFGSHLGLQCSLAGAAGRADYGSDITGRPISTLAPPGVQTIVLFFIASDCPVSNRYFPEMERLRHQFSARGVKFYYVYPNVTETPASIRAHEQAYAPGQADLPTLTDPRGELARLTGAHTTPEASVLLQESGHPRAVYVGRIDNRYLSLGQERPAATEHDLAQAISAALDHRPVPAPGGPAVGCSIVQTR